MIVEFNDKVYKKDGRSNNGLGILCYDIFKYYLKMNPDKNYNELQDIFKDTHKEFGGNNSKKKIIFNKQDFFKWFESNTNNDSKKDGRYFGYGNYGEPIKYNNEELYFTTQWGNKQGEPIGNIDKMINFAKEQGYEIEIKNNEKKDLMPVSNYDKKGFRKYLRNVAKQENGTPYASSTIDTYVNDLSTIIHILNSIDIYKDYTVMQIFNDFIENYKTNNNYLKEEFSKIMELENRTDENLYKSVITKIKKYVEYIEWKNSQSVKFNNKIKNIILYGVPGVGKTYSHKKLIDMIESGKFSDNDIFSTLESHSEITYYDKAKKEDRVRFITFHQSFGYEDFIEGFRPNEDGNIELQDGVFKDFCEKAKKSDKNFYFVIDEINRANISKVFGELITLIEEDKRKDLSVTLPYSKKPFSIPENLYIIGTMNSTDKSIALIDIALRRRFTFLKMNPNPKLVEKYPRAKEKMENLNEKIIKSLGEDYQIGHSYFMGIEDEEDLSFTCKYKIKPLLEEYFYGDKEGFDRVYEVIKDVCET